MHRIQIQTKSSQLLITQIHQDKPFGFSISPLMSILTTPNAQSLNFGIKIKWNTIEWSKTKAKLEKVHLEGENHKTQELARKRQMASRTKWKCNEKLNTPPTILNESSPPLVEFIMFSTNFSQPPG
jgi:hypothetical protein